MADKPTRIKLLKAAEALEAAEAWLRQSIGKEPQPSPLQLAYLEASRAYAQKRQRQNVQLLSGGIISALLLSAVAVYFAFQSSQNADEANQRSAELVIERNRAESAEGTAVVQSGLNQSLALAAQSELELQDQLPERSVLLAVEALETEPYTAQAEWALGRAIYQSRARGYRWDHFAPVTEVAWSGDGRLIASAGEDGLATIWDTESGERLHFLVGHQDRVSSVAWSPSQQFVVTGSWDNTARIWNVETGETVSELQGHTNWVQDVAYSPDGTYIATAGRENVTRIWDAQSGELITTLPSEVEYGQGISQVLWSPDGAYLLAVGYSPTVWDIESGSRVVRFNQHGAPISSAAWSADGAWVLTGATAGTARLWNAQTGEQILQFNERTDAARVDHVSWSPDGAYILTSTNYAIGSSLGESELRLWDADTGAEIRQFRGFSRWLTSVEWSPDGHLIFTSGSDAIGRIWEIDTGIPIVTIPMRTASMAWSPTSYMVVTGHVDGAMRLWDMGFGSVANAAHANTITEAVSVAWSPDSQRLASGHSDGDIVRLGVVRVWNPDTLEEQFVTAYDTSRYKYYMADVAWSPDGQTIAAASNGDVAVIFENQTGEELNLLQGHRNAIHGVAWSPDGQYLLTGSQDTSARIWELAAGGRVVRMMEHVAPVYGVAWSPDGQYVATASADSTVKIWDAATGEQMMTLRPESGEVYGVEWSPDGQYIATVTSEGSAQVWLAESGELVATMNGHTGRVNAVTWSPDGRRIATASQDTTVRVWDAIGGEELLFLTGHLSDVEGVAWSGDGEWLASASIDGTVRVWRVWQSTAELLAFAHDCCVIRSLSDDELAEFSITRPTPTISPQD